MSQISLKCCLCYIIKAFHPNPIPADLIPLLIPSQNVCNFNLKSCFFIFNMSLIFILSLLNCVKYYIWAQMGFHDMFSSPFSCIRKREGVLCWPITERSNANTVILPSSFLAAFHCLLPVDVESRTCTWSVQGSRVFSFWELTELQIYTRWKNLFNRAFCNPWYFWQNDSEKAKMDGKFFANFSSK